MSRPGSDSVACTFKPVADLSNAVRTTHKRNTTSTEFQKVIESQIHLPILDCNRRELSIFCLPVNEDC